MSGDVIMLDSQRTLKGRKGKPAFIPRIGGSGTGSHDRRLARVTAQDYSGLKGWADLKKNLFKINIIL